MLRKVGDMEYYQICSSTSNTWPDASITAKAACLEGCDDREGKNCWRSHVRHKLRLRSLHPTMLYTIVLRNVKNTAFQNDI